MNLIEITGLHDPRVAPFVSLTDAQLLSRLDPANALFIAESPKVIRLALAAGHRPVALLCERRHIHGDAADIITLAGDSMPVYTGSRDLLRQITGYTLTRGVLCAMHRPVPLPAEDLLHKCSRVAVLDGICDTTNVGAIFRSAAALGADAVALTPTTCDPLNRRAIRVSMGTVFQVPWTRIDADLRQIREAGFKTVALALRNDSIRLQDSTLRQTPRLAMLFGTEGDGLDPERIAAADYVCRIPMAHGVDSLNVAAAAAITLYELCARDPHL